MDNDEYKVLREEMKLYYDNIAKYTIALYTASNAVFAFALNKDEFYYCLIPLLIIIPLYLVCEDEHRKACKLGAYLNVFCEGESFNWERRHHYLEVKEGEKREINTIIPHIVLTFASCFSAAMKILLKEDCNKAYIIIPFIALVFSIIILYRNKVEYVKARETYIKAWEEAEKKRTERKQRK